MWWQGRTHLGGSRGASVPFAFSPLERPRPRARFGCGPTLRLQGQQGKWGPYSPSLCLISHPPLLLLRTWLSHWPTRIVQANLSIQRSADKQLQFLPAMWCNISTGSGGLDCGPCGAITLSTLPTRGLEGRARDWFPLVLPLICTPQQGLG